MSNPEAEVFVVVRPDLTRFRAELEAQLAAIGTKGIAVPITVGDASTAKQAAAIESSLGGIGAAAGKAVHPLEAVGVAMRNVGAATQGTVTVSGDYMAVAGTLPRTLHQQTVASNEAARAANDLLLAQKGLTREAAVVTASSKSASAALKEEAASAAAATAGVGNLGRGIASTALSLFGLRGATLAATGSFLAGAAAVTAFAKAIGAAVSFDRELSVLQATVGATSDEMARAGATARQLGRDISLPGVSAQDAVVTITELAKAGLTLQQAMDGARGTLQLATAAEIDNAHATELVANALNAFQLPGKAAVQVADGLANASNLAQGSIVDMGIALHQSAAVAHTAGLSFNDTIGLLTILARAGLTSSDAGTSLRTALIRLINPSKKAAEILDDLSKQGVRVRDSFGHIRADVFAQIGEALSGLTEKQRENTLAILGGSDAIRTYAILGGVGVQATQAFIDATKQSGTASDLAAARTKGLAGQSEQLKNNLSDLGITLGHVLIPVLINMTGALNDALGATQAFIDVVKQGVNPVKSFADSLGITGIASAVVSNAFLAQVSPAAALFKAYKALTASHKEVQVQSGLTADAFKALQGPTQFETNLLLEGAQGFLDAAKAARGLDGVSLDHIIAQTANLVEAITKVQIAGGSLGQQLAAVNAAIASQQKVVAGISAQPGQGNKKVAQQRRQAENDLLNLINQRKSITGQIKSAADQAAADRKQKAQAAQKKLDDADRDLLTALGLRRGAAENALERAGLTPGKSDDLRLQRALTEELERERAIVKKNIHDEDLKAQQVQQLTASIIQSKLATQALITARREEAKRAEEARKQAIQDRRDRQQESRELDVQVAEAKGNKSQEIKAHQALLTYLIQRRKHTDEGSVEYKRLTLAIEQERKAIRDLKNAQKATTNDLLDLQHEFLTRQQGFASTILSNILPASVTAGSVQGGAINTPTGIGPGPAGFASAAHRRANTLTAAAAVGGAQGATAGQLGTLIAVNRSILGVLHTIAGRGSTPEATRHRHMTNNDMLLQHGA